MKSFTTIKIATLTALIAAAPVQAGILDTVKATLHTAKASVQSALNHKHAKIVAAGVAAGTVCLTGIAFYKKRTARIKAASSSIDKLKAISQRLDNFPVIKEKEIDEIEGLYRSEKTALKKAIKNYNATLNIAASKSIDDSNPKPSMKNDARATLCSQLRKTIDNLGQSSNSWFVTLPKMAWSTISKRINRNVILGAGAILAAGGFGLYKYFSKK